MRGLLFILVFVIGNPGVYGQLDTHKVIQYLEVPKEKIHLADKTPLRIETYEELQHHLTTEGKMQKISFDFKANYIEGNYHCFYCKSCPDEHPCHRNACSYSLVWRVKSRAIKPVEYSRVFLDYLPLVLHREHKDTLVVHEKNVDTLVLDDQPPYIYLHQSVGGDCHARFSHDLFIDENNKTLYWLITNHYGGCRAGKFEEFYFKVKNPGKGYKVVFKESRE